MLAAHLSILTDFPALFRPSHVDRSEVVVYPLLRILRVSPENTPSADRKKSVARNPKATHDYHILDTWETGIVLTGTEVKSLRNGKASIREAYARVKNGEVFLEGMNITPYEQGNRYNHDPVRTRKLLLHRREIEKLIGAVEQRGLTLVPLELYFKNGRAKVALALGKGKKQHDKREAIKRKIQEREVARAVSIRGRR
jgi:SsrA-binding protein